MDKQQLLDAVTIIQENTLSMQEVADELGLSAVYVRNMVMQNDEYLIEVAGKKVVSSDFIEFYNEKQTARAAAKEERAKANEEAAAKREAARLAREEAKAEAAAKVEAAKAKSRDRKAAAKEDADA